MDSIFPPEIYKNDFYWKTVKNMVIITKGLSYNDTLRSPTIRQLYGAQNIWKSVKPNVELNSFWGLILLPSRGVKDKFQNFDFWEALSVHFYPRIDILYPK